MEAKETIKREAAPLPSDFLISKRCCPARLRTVRWLTPSSRAASRTSTYLGSFSGSKTGSSLLVVASSRWVSLYHLQHSLRAVVASNKAYRPE
jgi:hypothetical protein